MLENATKPNIHIFFLQPNELNDSWNQIILHDFRAIVIIRYNF